MTANHAIEMFASEKSRRKIEQRMRIAIISDVHGNLTALEAVLADNQQSQRICVESSGSSAGNAIVANKRRPITAEHSFPSMQFRAATHVLTMI
jgi:hypothetical protein